MQAVDVVVVGGGAAGLATAIFAARMAPNLSMHVLDGARKLGAKILISGGGRCNVTNHAVTERDYCGGSRNVIKRVLAALPIPQTRAFFQEIGVPLHEEEHGKLFPDTNRARTVLDALLAVAGRLGIRILPEHRVVEVNRREPGFEVITPVAVLSAQRVVLATGGQSFAKTGSDGGGYRLAAKLGHSLVPQTPALVPLILDGDFHTPLTGISHEVELTLAAAGWKPIRVRGMMLWTHFGVSGPVVLDVSRHWHRARLENRAVTLCVHFVPGADPAQVEAELLGIAASHPNVQLHNAAARIIPARVAQALLQAIRVSGVNTMAHLPKEDRRKFVRALACWSLPVRESRGYNHAEATAGGVPLSEIDPRTLASRKCPGLYFVGEILDVDGRIGGFNFQWAWSSAMVVATALTREQIPNDPVGVQNVGDGSSKDGS